MPLFHDRRGVESPQKSFPCEGASLRGIACSWYLPWLETRANRTTVRADLLETINQVLERLAARIESDAVVLVDSRQATIGAAGRMANRWPRTRPVSLAAGTSPDSLDSFDGDAMRGLAIIGVLGIGLAGIGSFWLARTLSEPKGEYSFAYTRMSGEIVRSRFERSAGTAIAYQ